MQRPRNGSRRSEGGEVGRVQESKCESTRFHQYLELERIGYGYLLESGGWRVIKCVSEALQKLPAETYGRRRVWGGPRVSWPESALGIAWELLQLLTSCS